MTCARFFLLRLLIAFSVLVFPSAADATNYITSKGVQQWTCTIASSATTCTATVSSVGSGAFILYGGENPSVANDPAEDFARVTLTNSTTITATRTTGTTGTVVVKGSIVDGDTTNLIKTVTYGTITIANGSSSGTDTALTGTAGNTAIHLLGWSSANATLSAINEYPRLTNPSNVPTATRAGTVGALTVAYEAIEFKSAALTAHAVQNIAATSSSSVTTYTAALGSNVVLANTMCFYGGSNIGTVTTNVAEAKQYGALTAVGTFTVTVNTAVADAKSYNASCAEFNSGVLNSAVQRSTTLLTGVTSSSTPLSSINKTYAGLSWMGNKTSATTAVLNEAEGQAALSTTSTIGIQQTAGNLASSSTTIAATLTATQPGSLIVAGVLGQTASNTVSGCTDNKSQIYIQVPSAAASDSTGGQITDEWYFPNSVAGVTTVTCTFNSSSPFSEMAVYELTSAALSSPVDAHASVSNGASTTTPVSGAITTTDSGDIIIVDMAVTGSLNSVNVPYTLDNQEDVTAYHITSGTVSGETSTWSTTAGTFCASSAAFKSATSNIVTVSKNSATANITGAWEVEEWPAFVSPGGVSALDAIWFGSPF